MPRRQHKSPQPIPKAWESLLRLIPGYDPIATAGTALFVETLEEVKLTAKRYGGPQPDVFCFVEELAGRALDFFPECLQHVKGELAGRPFSLAEWQGAIVANIFGWVRLDGSRRYREIFFFVPRKNGKTALAAGIVLFVLFCDGEHGAEIYSAAADKEQATLVFDHAKGMVLQEPELESRAKVYETYKSIVMASLGSVYKVVSAEASTKHGFNSL
jgi:phage terminase large subunit-like protein